MASYKYKFGSHNDRGELVNAFGPEDVNGNVMFPAWAWGFLHERSHETRASFWLSNNKHTMRCVKCRRSSSSSAPTQAQKSRQEKIRQLARPSSPSILTIIPLGEIVLCDVWSEMTWHSALNMELNSESPSRDDWPTGCSHPPRSKVWELHSPCIPCN